MSHRSLEEDISLSSSLDILITAYQKVSVSRMQSTRRQVLTARKFTETLSGVYADVRASQHHVDRRNIRGLLFKKQTPTSKHNKKPLVILISSNNRLDGGISRAIFQRFSKYVKDRECDILITGEVGASLFKEQFGDRPFKHVLLSKRTVTQADLLPLVKLTKNYVNVKIFYGKFINFIKQEPTVADLSDETLLPTNDKEEKESKYTPFIFEPSLPDIIAFFDTQILSALLSRTAQEGNLAEHGSRVTAMELARQKVDTLLSQFSEEALRNKKTIQNKRQQEQFASLMLWQTK
jgi:ATP synthase F1 gamma subunit